MQGDEINIIPYPNVNYEYLRSQLEILHINYSWYLHNPNNDYPMPLPIQEQCRCSAILFNFTTPYNKICVLLLDHEPLDSYLDRYIIIDGESIEILNKLERLNNLKAFL